MTDPHAGERLWRSLRAEVARAVVGAEQPMRLMTVALLAEGHALLEDVPGVGKTLVARAFARALGLGFGRVQGTPDLLPSDVTGSSVLADGSFRFIPGPIFTNVLLVDEINRATPRTQSALLEAMQERQVSVDGETRPIPAPFLVLATQNPIELEGTFALPEAQLDRFLVRIVIGYPAEADERAIARRYRQAHEPLESVQAVLEPAALADMRDAARTSPSATRSRATSCASCARRASTPTFSSARARAPAWRCTGRRRRWPSSKGATSSCPTTSRPWPRPVLTHRLMVDVDRELRGATAEGVIGEVLESVPVGVGTGAEAAR